MAITTATALLIGATVSAVGAAGSAVASKARADKANKQRRESQKISEAEQAKLERAPEIAAEKARKDSIRRRKSKTKTILTSPLGVTDSESILKKRLGD